MEKNDKGFTNDELEKMIKIMELRYKKKTISDFRDAVYKSAGSCFSLGLDEEEAVAWLQDEILKHGAVQKEKIVFQERLIRLWVHRAYDIIRSGK